jgi:hypothetical protein
MSSNYRLITWRRSNNIGNGMLARTPPSLLGPQSRLGLHAPNRVVAASRVTARWNAQGPQVTGRTEPRGDSDPGREASVTLKTVEDGR